MGRPSFGQLLDAEFNRLAASRPPRGASRGEVFLFRQLQSALVGASSPPRYIVEEFHGSGHQVYFPTTKALGLPRGRCELCDLMIVAFSDDPIAIRLTFFQAKYERRVLPISTSPAHEPVWANIMQWDLLSKRPSISPVYSTFSPPPNLLQGAFRSIGTFGFINDAMRTPTSVLYAAASELINATPAGRRYGAVRAPAPAAKPYARTGMANELVGAVDTVGFGDGLAAMLIGNPLEPNPAAPDDAWRRVVRGWLQRELPNLSSKGTLRGLLSNHLAVLLKATADGGRARPAKLRITPEVESLILARRDALRSDLPPGGQPPESGSPSGPSGGLPRTVMIYVASSGERTGD